MMSIKRAWSAGALGAAATLCAASLLSAAQGHLAVANRKAINPGLGTPPPQVSRVSPAAAWRSFMQLGEQQEFEAAAHLLDLTEVPLAQQRDVGETVAKRLYRVLRTLGVARDAVTTDDAEGPKEGGEPLNVVVVTNFRRAGISGEVWLRRTRDQSSGELAWLFTRQTVSSVPFWYSVIIKGERPKGALDLDVGLGELPASVQRSNPRETLTGFLAAATKGRFHGAAFYLDLSAIPAVQQSAEGARLARRLMLVLLRKGWIKSSKVSNDSLGAPELGIPENQELLASPSVEGKPVDILLGRQWDAQLGQIWTFTPETVAQIDTLYDAYGYGWIGDHLPTLFFALAFAGLQLWQWLALLLIVGLGFGVARVVGHWLVLLFRSLAARTSVEWDDAVAQALDGPLGFVLWAATIALAGPIIGLTVAAQAITHMAWKLLALIGVGWLLFRLLDLFTMQMRRAGGRNTLALSLVPIVHKIGKFVVTAMILLAALDVVGVKVVALLAGFGLGGLAIAFAAQKTLENLFGALAIAGDQPFKVGDFVTVNGITGTVEDVGLRSTRVRTSERTLVTIPNGSVVAGPITNFTARDRMLYNPTIGVVYGTTAAQLTYITDEIRKLLLTHPRVSADTTRCRFASFGDSALNLEVFTWIETSDYNEYTAIAEELNFAIARIVESSGSGFAFPSQTLYLARDGGLDAARAREIAAEIEERRRRGELAVPEPSDELAARLKAQRSKDSS